MTVPTKFQIGTVAGGTGGMVDLDTLLSLDGRAVDPDFVFTDYSGNADLEDTTRLGVGYSMCTWSWAVLTSLQRYALRQYCPGLSAQVLITVPTNETDSSGVQIWHTYQATMLWITRGEDRQLDDRSDVMTFEITFRALILVA